jgi:hypothetical protein
MNVSNSEVLESRRQANIGSICALALAVALAGCGGTGQDDGSPSEFSQQFSGLVIDGYVSRATVFIDSNNNGTRDAWEPWAFTDDQGYYSFNPLTNTNYCAATATAQQAQYCLLSNVAHTNVVIRIDSGYDVVTGEPFLGQMSRRVNAGSQDDLSDLVVTPITSLLADVESTADRNALMQSLNINESDLDVDYLNTDGSGGVNAPLLNTALKIHKVVTVLSDRLTDTYAEIGEDFGTPNDATSSVYPNLAEQIIAAGSNLDESLSNPNVLLNTLDAAENAMREVYENKEFNLPQDMGSAANPGNFARVVEVAMELPMVVDNLIDPTSTDFNYDDATASTRALETLVIKAVDEGPSSDESIENVIDFFNPESQDHDQDLVDSLLATLSLDNADVSSLSNNDFSGEDFDSVDDIVSAASFTEDATPFTQIGGLQLRIAELDLGTQTDAKDSEIEFYFSGAADDVSGSFSSCVKFIDGADVTTNSLGEGNTRGEIVDGFWSLLGADEGDVESYTLLLTLTFLGTTYQAIMKPAGTGTVDDVSYQLVRFDLGSDVEVFHSEAGLVTLSSLPETNADCEARLPSRIGL